MYRELKASCLDEAFTSIREAGEVLRVGFTSCFAQAWQVEDSQSEVPGGLSALTLLSKNGAVSAGRPQ